MTMIDLGRVRAVRAQLAELAREHPELCGPSSAANVDRWIEVLEEERTAEMRVCEGCGIQFQPTRRDQRFHDAPCKARAHRERTERPTAMETILLEAAGLERRHKDRAADPSIAKGRAYALATLYALIELELPGKQALADGRERAAKLTAEERERLASPVKAEPEAAPAPSPVKAEPEAAPAPSPVKAEPEAAPAPSPVKALQAKIDGMEGKVSRRSADDLDGLREGIEAAIDAGYSQKTIAETIRIDPGAFSRFRHARSNIGPEPRKKLAAWLNRKGL